jgi:tetratricopeptide (TPR) repeat protein
VWPSILLIAVATLAAYSNSLHAPFILDDVTDIIRSTSIRHLWPLRDVFVVHIGGKAVLHPRPFANLTLAVNYAMGGLETFPYHATNLAIHLLAGLTLFGIVRRTLMLPGLTERFGRVATPLALAVAMLWALHPIQTQAVTYVTQRYESMMGLFYLLAVYAVIRSDASAQRRAWATASVAAALVAMGCKEVAISAPLCILLYDRAFLAGSFREAWNRRRGMYCGLAGVWAAFAALMVSSSSRSTWSGFDMPLLPWFDYAKTQFGVILHYVRMSFWPRPLVLDYGWPVARSLGEILPGAVVVGGLAAASVHALVRRPKWGFLGAWFFLILAPTSSIMPIADVAFIHRMYLPLAAIVVAVVIGGQIAGEAIARRQWMPRKGVAAVGIGVVTAIAISMAAGTWRRNNDYSSPLSIWTDTVAKAPDNARAQNNLGNILAAQGKIDEAAAHYQEALHANPRYAGAHYNLGIIFADRGQFDEAITHYRKALEINPEYVEAHNNLGNILARRGQIDEAIAHYRRALEINPEHVEAHNNLGNILARLGQTDAAITHYRKALEFNPEYVEAHYNLGVMLARRGQTAEAITHYRRALNLAVQQGRQALAEDLKGKLAVYEAGTPVPR